MRDIYRELSIEKNAPKEEIKNKYKNFCKKNHPDMGGNTEVFQEKQQYYAILLSDQKRKRYDETGETGTEDKFSKIITLAVSVFNALIEKNPDNLDESLLDLKSHILNGINQNISSHKKEKEKLIKFLKRVKLKTKGDNPMFIHIDRKIKNLKINIDKMINDKKDYEEVFSYINDNFIFENIDPEECGIFRTGTNFNQRVDLSDMFEKVKNNFRNQGL